MGFLDKIFGNRNAEETNEVLIEPKFYVLNQLSQLDEINTISKTKPVAIFKHSTRCSISRFALKDFDKDFDYPDESIEWFLLDLINYRAISNEISSVYNVQHQSPQLIVIKNGKAVYCASHEAIDANVLKQFI